jgi:transposase-like protein
VRHAELETLPSNGEVSLAKKKQKKWTHYGLEFKIQAIKRVAGGEKVTSVAQDVGINRGLLNRWRKRYPEFGAAGRLPPGVPEVEVPGPAEIAARRIAELERKIGQQEVQIDFLARAFERVKELRRPKNGSGGSASTGRSR